MKALDLRRDLNGSVLSREILFGLSAKSRETGYRNDRLVENGGELLRGKVGERFKAGQHDSVGHFFFQAGDGVVSDAAGDDEVEVKQVWVEIEGETMGGDAAGDVNPNGGNFAGRSDD